MGRPKGSKNKSTLIKEGLMDPKTGELIRPEDDRDDDEILSDTIERFNVFWKFLHGMIDGDINSMIVSGAPGVGKTYTTRQVLEAKREEGENFRYEMVTGACTPVELYKLAYRYRQPGNVIVLDDSDALMNDENGLNLLKGLLDSGDQRKVSWRSNASALKEEGEETPKSFIFNGSIAFLTNQDFQWRINAPIGRSNVEHMKALMDRTLYLDLKMHTPREVSVWLRHIVLQNKILQRKGLSQGDEQTAVDWICERYDKIRGVSIRTALKVAQIMMISGEDWETDARHTLLK